MMNPFLGLPQDPDLTYGRAKATSTGQCRCCSRAAAIGLRRPPPPALGSGNPLGRAWRAGGSGPVLSGSGPGNGLGAPRQTLRHGFRRRASRTPRAACAPRRTLCRAGRAVCSRLTFARGRPRRAGRAGRAPLAPVSRHGSRCRAPGAGRAGSVRPHDGHGPPCQTRRPARARLAFGCGPFRHARRARGAPSISLRGRRCLANW